MKRTAGPNRDKTMSSLDRLLVISIVLLASVFPVELFPNQTPTQRGGDGQFSGKQGQILVITVPDLKDATSVKGRFLGRTVTLFPNPSAGETGYIGLLGIDLQDEPGAHELTIDAQLGEQVRHFTYQVFVAKEKFAVEHLTLPKDKVDLDEKAAARWKAEQEQVRKALAEESAMRLWKAGFIEPVRGKRTGIFGSVRIMNGQARNPHNGEDIGAPLGTVVMASNDGIVRLTVDHIFSGRGIYLDHGLGLYSMYFHLSDVLVKEGDLIKAGQIIGKVGATGRATGPHLHWGMKANGARVNPYALLELPFPQNSVSATPVFAAPAFPAKENVAPTAVGSDTR
ncbi:MAG: Peptidase M23B [Nitrospira sp.]|jgi:murein DD-endopeptidase MepM/ murein hydrolase activator NlpD|nr:MAG: Peptidase M23B [Nitrospira sp.]